jgi:hypothetical protein
LVTVDGENFVNFTARWQCSFDGVLINATWISEQRIRCDAVPQVTADGSGNTNKSVAFILFQNGEPVWDASTPLGYNVITYQYLSPCPNSYCSNHGFCALGVCICNYGWLGTQCSVQQLPVQLATPDVSYNATEGASFTFTPQLLNGTSPITWTLTTIPSGVAGVSIDASTGQVRWLSVAGTGAAVDGSLQFTITADNGLNRVSITSTVTVLPSYECSAYTDTVVSPNYDPNSAVRIRINGNCTLFSGGMPARSVSAKVWSLLRGVMRVLDTVQTDNNGQFITYWSPSQYEAGIFVNWVAKIFFV